MVWCGRSTRTDWTSGCSTCTAAYIRERIERRALPSRRVEIPKPDGGTRPLGIAALEDKIVQKAVVDVILTPIYEPAFLGFSYGFRPGRGAHDALDALAFGIERRKVSWIIDADIRAFLDPSSYCPQAYEECSKRVA